MKKMEPLDIDFPEDILDAAVNATPDTQEVSATEVLDAYTDAIDMHYLYDVPSEEDSTASSEEPVEEQEVVEKNPVTVRFSSAVWFEEIQKQEICLAGLGGIGSYVAFLLSRMHPKRIFMFDPDTIEEVNLAGQLFSRTDVGSRKCNAIARRIADYSDYYSVIAIDRPFTIGCYKSPVMICGFDNMEARKDFYKTWKDYVDLDFDNLAHKSLFIDGRLSAEAFQVIAIQGDDLRARKKYEEEFLFDDSQADATICSYKQTSYMASMIASMMVNVFTNWVANLAGEYRPVPFFTEYDASTTYLNVKM